MKEVTMHNKNDLIFMGKHLVSSFHEKASQGGELAHWNRECAISCSILLDYLNASSKDADKALFLANLFKHKYEKAKPPIIARWCAKVSEFLLSIEPHIL